MIFSAHKVFAISLICVTSCLLAPQAAAEPSSSANCDALGRISESLDDDIGDGLGRLQVDLHSIYTRTTQFSDLGMVTHGANYMNQVNSTARIGALDTPLRNLSSTIGDLQSLFEQSKRDSEYGPYISPTPPVKQEMQQDVDQATQQQQELVDLVGQLQQSNRCPVPPPS